MAAPAAPAIVRKKHKVMITCAVTGSIHTPSMSPHLPITAEEIADAAIGAAEAGAASSERSRLRVGSKATVAAAGSWMTWTSSMSRW